MRRLAAFALLLSGCTCNDRPVQAPVSISAQELSELRKAAPDGAKCSAFQIVEENGKRRLDCVMARPDAGAL